MTSEGSGGGKRRQLGRGLSSLLGDDGDDVAQMDRGRQTRLVAIENIEPGAAQPRRVFDEIELQALADSIRERGVLQPILLRRPPENDGALEIIAGERRWRAAQIAGLHEIPALVRDFTDTEALEIALIENIQRSDLTALEEANGFQRLIDEYGHTQEDVAQAIGKSRSHVANTLRLLALPPKAREHLEAGRLTAGHARALLVSDEADRLADYVVAGGLSVRATERLVQGRAGRGSSVPRPASANPSRPAAEKDADTRALEKSITESLGLTVDIMPKDPDRGTLTIHYQSLDQLDDLLSKLTATGPTEASSLVVSDALFSDGDLDNYTMVDGSLEVADLETDGASDDRSASAEDRNGEQPEGDEDEDPDGEGATVDFSALMAQTASLLASGAAADDLDGEVGDDKASGDSDVRSTGSGGAGALVSGILDALDIVDPPSKASEPAETDGLEEWENDVLANISANGPEPAVPSGSVDQPEPKIKPASPKPLDDPNLDDEIEFID